MAEQAQVIDIVEPMQDHVSKAGKPYKAMKLAIKKSDNEIKTMMSFDEYKVGEIVSIEKNEAGYWQIVKPSRGYDKPLSTPAGANGSSDVMQSLRFIYTKLSTVEEKLDALLKDTGVPYVDKTTTDELKEFFGGNVPASVLPEPSEGFNKFQQARARNSGGPIELNDIPIPNGPDDYDQDIPDERLDISKIPF